VTAKDPTKVTDFDSKNAEAYAELVQLLDDDRSLSLIIRDAADDGQGALQILRNHYLPNADYLIRAETTVMW
jgi:hypothetical protein